MSGGLKQRKMQILDHANCFIFNGRTVRVRRTNRPVASIELRSDFYRASPRDPVAVREHDNAILEILLIGAKIYEPVEVLCVVAHDVIVIAAWVRERSL